MKLAIYVFFISFASTFSELTIDETIVKAMNLGNSTGPFDKYESKNEYLAELDMMLTKAQFEEMYLDKNGRQRRKTFRNINKYWKNKIMPYKFDLKNANGHNSEERARIISAMDDLAHYTCVRFKNVQNENLKNYVFFIKYKYCYSGLGEAGGKQYISLGNGCLGKKTITHEVGHALGLYHEQSRPDRDEYLIVHLERMKKDFRGNIKKCEACTTYNVPYDYTSMMHYGPSDFAITKGDIILETKDPKYQNVIGHAQGISFQDIHILNIMYKCNEHCSRELKNRCPAGAFLGKDCKCWCKNRNPGNHYNWNPYQVCDFIGGTTTSPTDNCSDKNTRCEVWAQRNYCMKYKDYMKKKCRKACNLCDGPTGNCSDKSEKCRYWARRPFCGIFKKFMANNCRRSCNLC